MPVALVAAAALWGGGWGLAAVLVLSALTALLYEAIHHVTPHTAESEFPAAKWLSVSLGIAHFVVLFLVVNALANQPYVIPTKIGLFIAAGFFFGQISNSNAHELIHSGGSGMHRLGKWV